MSSVEIYNSTPNILYTGIQDLSTRTIIPEPEKYPQHLPLFFVFSEKGNPDDVHVVSKTAFIATYGNGFIDYNSKYATHSSPFLDGITSEGNLVMVQRLKPRGASTAWIRFSLGLLKQELVDSRIATAAEKKANDPRIVNGRIHEPRGYSGWTLRWITSTPDVADYDLSSFDERTRALIENSSRFGSGLSVGQLGGLGEAQSQLSTGISVGFNPRTVTEGGELVQERIYPMFDLQVTDFGAYGNNLGVRLWCPNTLNTSKPDTTFYGKTLVREYRAAFVKRGNKRSTSTILPNILGEDITNFVLKPETPNELLGGDDMYMVDRLLETYRNLDVSNGRIPTYGPFNHIHAYEENIRHVVETLYKTEHEYELANKVASTYNNDGTLAPVEKGKIRGDVLVDSSESASYLYEPGVDDDDSLQENKKWQIDIFTGLTFNGYNYRTFKVLDMYDETTQTPVQQMTANTEHYAKGGNDGEMGNHEYNRLVANKIIEMTNEYSHWNDLARFPWSVFYDTGFPMYVKDKMPELIRTRKDVSICLATHSLEDFEDGVTNFLGNRTATIRDGVTPLTREQEVGMVRALYAIATRYLESEVFGTKSCRANIIMQCGTILNSPYKGKVPMTYEIAMKRAKYMGDTNGAYRAGYGYDQPEMKKLQYVKELNNTFIPYVQRERNWTHGATWAQFFDRRTMFFPAVRTVYKDETSVLISDINMLIATDLEKVCFRAWRHLVGNAKLTNAQFIEESNRIIAQSTDSRYDGRVTITPETYYTAADKLRGYSWHCKIHAYMNNMKTVGVFTVVTHRQEELEG